MRKINNREVLRLVLVLALVAGIGLAFGSVGRFVPTHKIVMPVYCGSCHPEQVSELNATTHLGKFAQYIDKQFVADNISSDSELRTSANLISGGCQLCHNYWENMKWFGVANFAINPMESDNPVPPKDIYGNLVSPYGLGSTQSWEMNVSFNYTADHGKATVPWTVGLDAYQYSANGVTFSRLDYVWSKLSSVSPGPVGFRKFNMSATGSVKPLSSCGIGGSAEHGMCHFARDGLVISYEGSKAEANFNVLNGIGENPSNFATPKWYSNDNKITGRGAPRGGGIFFTHEMAFTTAQYAAKPVKICGACHVLKLPPMKWGGEPWAISEVQAVSQGLTTYPTVNPTDPLYDPFGFRPTYNDLTGNADVIWSGRDYNVAFRTPDWAHSNVPCIRCHAHAGINGDTVSDNAPQGPPP